VISGAGLLDIELANLVDTFAGASGGGKRAALRDLRVLDSRPQAELAERQARPGRIRPARRGPERLPGTLRGVEPSYRRHRRRREPEDDRRPQDPYHLDD
jgi:hypothetical protein